MTFKQNFGATVKQARTALNLTASELAAMIGVSSAQVYNIEAGKSFPGNVDSLLKALNIECKFTPPGKVTKIEVHAKEYNQRNTANSYFSARVYIHRHNLPETVLYLPFQGGTGDQYLFVAFEAVKKAGFIDTADRMRNLASFCRENGIPFEHSKQENVKEKFVIEHGKQD